MEDIAKLLLLINEGLDWLVVGESQVADPFRQVQQQLWRGLYLPHEPRLERIATLFDLLEQVAKRPFQRPHAAINTQLSIHPPQHPLLSLIQKHSHRSHRLPQLHQHINRTTTLHKTTIRLPE